jgi:hypothetical protein
MVLIYQPPNAHERILLRNAMAVAAVKKIYNQFYGTLLRKFTLDS